MELNKLIKDLKDMRKAGFIDCNIQCFLDKLEKVTESVVVDQFIADWFEKYKGNLEHNIWAWMRCTERGEGVNKQFYLWLNNCNNKPVETLVKMKLYGYMVKEDKKYTVKIKSVNQYLVRNTDEDFLGFLQSRLKSKFTRKELEEVGLEEVFNNPLFEVEEVE